MSALHFVYRNGLSIRVRLYMVRWLQRLLASNCNILWVLHVDLGLDHLGHRLLLLLVSASTANPILLVLGHYIGERAVLNVVYANFACRSLLFEVVQLLLKTDLVCILLYHNVALTLIVGYSSNSMHLLQRLPLVAGCMGRARDHRLVLIVGLLLLSKPDDNFINDLVSCSSSSVLLSS